MIDTPVHLAEFHILIWDFHSDLGLVRKGVEPHVVEPPRKKSSCVRTPQVDTIEEEIADQTHGTYMALQQPANATTHGLPVEDPKLVSLFSNVEFR